MPFVSSPSVSFRSFYNRNFSELMQILANQKSLPRDSANSTLFHAKSRSAFRVNSTSSKVQVFNFQGETIVKNLQRNLSHYIPCYVLCKMTLLTVTCAFVIVFLYLIWTFKKSSKTPPGPVKWPIVGSTFLIRKLSKELGGQYEAYTKLHRDYKSNIISLKLGRDEYIVIFGRKLFQQVCTRDDFHGRPDSFFFRLRTMGARRGITMTEGKLWREQRTFTERQLRQLGFGKLKTENHIKEELDNLLNSLSDQRDDIFLCHKLSSLFSDVLWTVVSGKRFSKAHELDKLLRLMEERCKAFDMSGGLLSQLPWLRFIAPDYCGYSLIQSINAKLFELIQDVINEHKRTITNETRDFIDAYLHEKESCNSDTSTFTDDQLIAICLDFFIAGASTTSPALDFAILETVRNPHVQQRVHEEIDNVLTRQQIPSLEDRSRLPYIDAVLLESYRYQHIAPILGPKRVLKDTMLDGYKIPKNTIVLMSLKSIHYDEARYKDPEVFKPERFLSEDGQLIPDEGLHVFGLGKRRCPGEVLAKSFIFLAFTSLFNRYKVTFPDGKEPNPIPKAGIFIVPEPYSVNLQAR